MANTGFFRAEERPLMDSILAETLGKSHALINLYTPTATGMQQNIDPLYGDQNYYGGQGAAMSYVKYVGISCVGGYVSTDYAETEGGIVTEVGSVDFHFITSDLTNLNINVDTMLGYIVEYDNLFWEITSDAEAAYVFNFPISRSIHITAQTTSKIPVNIIASVVASEVIAP